MGQENLQPLQPIGKGSARGKIEVKLLISLSPATPATPFLKKENIEKRVIGHIYKKLCDATPPPCKSVFYNDNGWLSQKIGVADPLQALAKSVDKLWIAT